MIQREKTTNFYENYTTHIFLNHSIGIHYTVTISLKDRLVANLETNS